MEEEHRRILREALLGKAKKKPSVKEYLLAMPDVGPDDLFERHRDLGRKVLTTYAARAAKAQARNGSSVASRWRCWPPGAGTTRSARLRIHR